MRNQKRVMSRRKTEMLVSIAFTFLMFILAVSEIVYVPISETRTIDLSLVPVVFASMIGGYAIAIPVGIGWVIVSATNHLGELYDWQWFIATKLVFPLALVYFYKFFRTTYKQSPWNVYRTILAAVTIRHILASIAIAVMFPEAAPSEWIRDSLLAYIIELSICLLAMHLLIDKLRQVHILNGVKRKEKIKREHKSNAHHKQRKPSKKEVV